MYNSRSNLLIGFHGCDEKIRDKLIFKPNEIKKSREKFDWLGHGFYVWEYNYKRAKQWAEYKKTIGKISKPSVLGVVFQLDYCLDFTDSEYIDLLSEYYEQMKKDFSETGQNLPKNKNFTNDENNDLIIRELDCAVIEYLHEKIDENIIKSESRKIQSNFKRFDTVRGIFTEGGPAFEGAGIQKKNHIQVCIRNLNCIKGFFIPRM
ncbi:MAG TPA: hypothetical protein PLG90_05830 [Ignavibacteria bacterium]|nr:hypothetical protein [Ignavibacteria bacterium]